MHPNYAEVKYTLEQLVSEGFILHGTNDGEEIITTHDLNTILDTVCNLDECWVETEKDGITIDFFFVLGNEPGVAVNDYTYNKILNPLIEKIIDRVYNDFNS